MALTSETDGTLPGDIAISETVHFVKRFPVGERPRVLEVGCGAGELAAALSLEGWKMRGIDIDAERVAAARERGVNALQADLLTFESEPFDVVLVTHSLHHISPLDLAVDRISRLIRPGGWLLVEEYDYAAVDASTASWLDERRAWLELAGVLRGDGPRPQLVQDPLSHPGHGAHAAHRHLTAPRVEHRHGGHGEHAPAPGHPHPPLGPDAERAGLHTGPDLHRAIAARFEILHAERVPYLFRFLCSELEPTPRGTRLARLALEQERVALDQKRIQPLGLRLAVRQND